MNDSVPVLSARRVQAIIWTLLCLMPMVGMVVDLVAPSLPAIATGLQVSTASAKAVISLYLFGYALGNLSIGFLTDALGRQRLIRVALLSFMVVSLLPVFFPHITILLLARFLQGITMGAVAVVARAIFSDVLSPEKLVRLGTMVGTMWGLGPVIGPVIGGYLQFYFGWQAGFCFFACVSFLGFIATYFIVPETHFNRHPLNITIIKNNFVEILTHRVFMAIVILMGLVYSLIISFNTLGPFLIQNKLHYSPVFFGHAALCLGLVFLCSTFVCRYLLKQYETEQLLLTVIHLFFIIAVLAVTLSYFFASSIVLIMMASAFMFFATGFIFPLSMGKGMSLFRHIAGTATATMYFVNVLMTSLTAFLMGFINILNIIPLMWIYLALMLFSVVVYWSMIYRR